MKRLTPLLCLPLTCLTLLAGALSVRADSTGSDDPSPALSMYDLLGAWHGTMTHVGEEETFDIELERQEDGKILLRWTVPAMNLSRLPVAVVEPGIEEGQITLGSLVLDYDSESDTLSGTMPASMVPLYEVPITLRRVEDIPPLERPALAAPGAEPLWSFDAGAALWPGPTFADGVVYAGDDAGTMHALSAESGAERWSFTSGGPIRTRPTVVDGSIVFQADDGILYRLDAATGAEVWRSLLLDGPVERHPPGDPQSRYDHFGSDVTVAGDRLFVGTHDGRVLAIDAADGSVQWQHSVNGSVVAAPAVSAGRVFVGAFGGEVHALDAATGELQWAIDTGGDVLSTPAVAGERIIVGNRSYDILALMAGTGEVAWKRYVWFSWIESPATVRGDVAYIGTSDAAAVYALSVETGQPLWETDVRGWSWGQPAVGEERVYVQTSGMRGYQADNHRGAVLALDRASGRVLWRYAAEPPAEGAWGFPGSPAVGAGRVFVAGLDGRVLAFRE